MLTAPALLAPLGLLDPSSVFPDDGPGAVAQTLTAYLADAYQRWGAAGLAVDADGRDDYARAHAYGRAFRARYVALLNRPSSVSKGDRETSYLITQIEDIGKLAAAYEAEAAAELAAGVAASLTLPAAPPPRVSRAVPTEYAW